MQLPHFHVHDCILITNLMHRLLFIHKILCSSTCFETQVLIFSRIQLYTCSIWQCHSLWEFVVACRYTAWVRTQVDLTFSLSKPSTPPPPPMPQDRQITFYVPHIRNSYDPPCVRCNSKLSHGTYNLWRSAVGNVTQPAVTLSFSPDVTSFAPCNVAGKRLAWWANSPAHQ